MTDSVRIVRFGENDWRNLLITELKRTGGDPSVLFEILEGIVAQRAWEVLLDESGEPVGSLRRMIEAPPPIGCGQKVEKVLQLLDIEHRYETDNRQWHERMTRLREKVRKELSAEQAKLGQHGGARNSSLHVNLTNGKKLAGNSRAYKIARLERDAPDIAKRVTSGELSASAGIRELEERSGVEKKRMAIAMHDAESAARTITENMPADVLSELIDLLIEFQRS